ncbi:hypothetical protein BDW60DRAFT_54381 [Aspergillus nidulans var. acristatus]
MSSVQWPEPEPEPEHRALRLAHLLSFCVIPYHSLYNLFSSFLPFFCPRLCPLALLIFILVFQYRSPLNLAHPINPPALILLRKSSFPRSSLRAVASTSPPTTLSPSASPQLYSACETAPSYSPSALPLRSRSSRDRSRDLI